MIVQLKNQQKNQNLKKNLSVKKITTIQKMENMKKKRNKDVVEVKNVKKNLKKINVKNVEILKYIPDAVVHQNINVTKITNDITIIDDIVNVHMIVHLPDKIITTDADLQNNVADDAHQTVQNLQKNQNAAPDHHHHKNVNVLLVRL